MLCCFLFYDSGYENFCREAIEDIASCPSILDEDGSFVYELFPDEDFGVETINKLSYAAISFLWKKFIKLPQLIVCYSDIKGAIQEFALSSAARSVMIINTAKFGYHWVTLELCKLPDAIRTVDISIFDSA